MNSFDTASLILTASAALRGYRSGLARESYRLFRLLVALVTGTSAYRILADTIGGLTDQTSAWLSPVVFVGITVIVWSLLKRLRVWMERSITARVPSRYQALGGAAAASAKTLAFIAGIIGTFSLASWLPGQDLIVHQSTLAGWLQAILPTR